MTQDVLHLPEYREWSVAAVRLLQGVVYYDDTDVWDNVLRNTAPLEEHFARLGLRLILDEAEGFAFLKQFDEEDSLPNGYDTMPRLFRRSRLSYDATLLCVLLREELRRFDEEELQHQRCVIPIVELFDQWKLFFQDDDEVRLKRSLDAGLRTLEGLKFVRQFCRDPEEWEIRRILKARLTVAELQNLKQQLLAARATTDPQD